MWLLGQAGPKTSITLWKLVEDLELGDSPSWAETKIFGIKNKTKQN